MGIINPALAMSSSKTDTPTDARLSYEIDRTLPVARIDYENIYKMMIVANTVLWVAYLLGMMK